MARRNRRLSPASVYRYILKRIAINVGVAGRMNGGTISMSPDVMKEVLRTSAYETYNWLTDYSPSHLAKSVAKAVAEKYHVPTAFQGLLMAFAEKVLANYILDYKGESLVEIHHNFLWALMQRSKSPTVTSSGFIYTFVRKDGKPVVVDMSKVLTEIEDQLFKLAGKT